MLRGQRIGSYEIVSLLGTGGMGEVYRDNDDRMQRKNENVAHPQDGIKLKKP